MTVELKNKIQLIPANDIKPNNYNPNYMSQELFEDLIDDIKRNGFYGAILLNKKNVIIDGEHRWRALKALGQEQIPVIYEGEADDNLSKILTLRLNRERGFLVPVETSTVLKSLIETIPIDILAETTQIPQEEIHLLTSIKFDPDINASELTDARMQWGSVEQILQNLADNIKKLDGKFIEISTISKGGLVPARLLADRLSIDKITILNPDDVPQGLVVDDIYDTGKTYRKYGKKARLYVVLHHRKGVKLPDNVMSGLETQGSEYIVYPWDKFEFKRKVTTEQRKQ